MLSLHLVCCPADVWGKGCGWTGKLTRCREFRNGDEQSSRHSWMKVVPALSSEVDLFPHQNPLLLMSVTVLFHLTLFHRSYPPLPFIFSGIFHCSSHTCLKSCSTSDLTLFLFTPVFMHLPQELTAVIDILGCVKPTKDSILLKRKKKIAYYSTGNTDLYTSLVHL